MLTLEQVAARQIKMNSKLSEAIMLIHETTGLAFSTTDMNHKNECLLMIRDACKDAMNSFHQQVNSPEPDHTDYVNSVLSTVNIGGGDED